MRPQEVTGPMHLSITEWAATVPPLYALPASPLAQGQLRKALKKVYNYEGAGVMSVEQYIQMRQPNRKAFWAQEHSDKRVHLCYVKFAKPKMHYYVCWGDNNANMSISKTVYDALALPDHDYRSDYA